MPMDKCTFNPGNECLGMQKANMLEKSLNSHLDAARQTHKEMYDRIRALETESARRDEQYVQILDKLDEMSSKITSALSQVSEIQINYTGSATWSGGKLTLSKGDYSRFPNSSGKTYKYVAFLEGE